MVKDKEWLEEELSKLTVYKSWYQTAFEGGSYPVQGNYNATEVDELVAQLGEPLDEEEQQRLF